MIHSNVISNFLLLFIGYSWGVPGYRVTRTASGKTRTTASIPGTGISYVSPISISPLSFAPSVPLEGYYFPEFVVPVFFNVSSTAMEELRAESKQPSYEMIVNISRFFKVSTDYLLGAGLFEPKTYELVTLYRLVLIDKLYEYGYLSVDMRR